MKFHVQTLSGSEMVEADTYKERGAYTVFIRWAALGHSYFDVASFATDKMVAIRAQPTGDEQT